VGDVTDFYRGDDRRAVTSGPADRMTARLVGGGTALLLAGAVWWLKVASQGAIHPAAETALCAVGAVMGWVAAGAMLLHWRTTGHTVGVPVAIAFMGLGIICLGDVIGAPHELFVLARGTAAVTAACWFARGVLGAEIDTSLRPARELAAWLIGTTVLVVVAAASGAASGHPVEATDATLHLLAGTAWLVGATGAGVRALTRSRPLLAWLGTAALGLAVAELMVGIHTLQGGAGGHGAAVMILGGQVLAGLGAALAISRYGVDGRTEAHSRLVQRREGDARAAGEERTYAHEVRNALLAIEGASVTLERHDGRLTSEQRHDLERALVNGADRLRHLVLDRGGSRERAEVITVGAVIRDAAALARARGVAVEVAGDLGSRVRCAPTVLAQVVENLVVNAQRHGGVDERQPLTVEVMVVDGQVQVRFVDRGPGIPAAHRRHVFEAGYRVRHDRDGSGLGLAVVRELVSRQGGSVWYEELATGGACFVVSLPSADAAKVTAGPGGDEVDDRR
jgi:signal transduction histidine kinase